MNKSDDFAKREKAQLRALGGATLYPPSYPMLLKSPPLGLDLLKEEHIRCKNFQFGCQVFDVDVVGEGAEGVVVTALRDGSSLRRTESQLQ